MTITHEVRTSLTASPVLADAIEPVPGLYVYHQPAELRRPGDTYLWRLGHHSGLSIAKFEYPGDAQDAAHLIADFTDWTRSAEAIQADASLDLYDLHTRINYETPGVLLSGRPA